MSVSPGSQRCHRIGVDTYGDVGTTLSWHARTRAGELGFTAEDIHECARFSEQSYPSHRSYGPNRRTYQRGPLAVVLDEDTKTVITVLLRTARTWQHGFDSRSTVVCSRDADSRIRL